LTSPIPSLALDDPPDDALLDAGIAEAVNVLRASGVETYESCQGGAGHCYAEPTVRFHGSHPEGFRALGVALQHGLRVQSLARIWTVQDGEPTGPTWEMVMQSHEFVNRMARGHQ
jgi:hypothetical protein